MTLMSLANYDVSSLRACGIEHMYSSSPTPPRTLNDIHENKKKHADDYVS